VSDPASGLLTHPVGLAIEMARQAHAVTALSWTGSRGQMTGLAGMLEQAGVGLSIAGCLARSGSVGAFVQTARQMPGRTAAPAADLLVAFGPFAAWQARRIVAGTPRVATFVEAMGHDRRSRVKPWLGALLLNMFTDDVIALCRLESDRLRRLGVRPGKLHIVHNPIDVAAVDRALAGLDRDLFLQSMGLPPTRRYLACLASFLPRKRQDLLIEAFAEVAGRFAHHDLLLAGDGPEKQGCAALARRLGIGDRVAILNRLPSDDAIRLLACASAAVHCSNAETFGYSMIEPLLVGIPALVTRVGIGWELEQAGMADVVPPDDRQALVRGLGAVLARAGKPDLSASRARDFARGNFDVASITRQIVALAAGERQTAAADRAPASPGNRSSVSPPQGAGR